MVNKTLICKRKPWDLGTWAWLLNRIAGTAIILYLIAHIFVISVTQNGAESFDSLMAMMHKPVPLALELVLVMAVIAHGLNGLRHILIDFGICRPRHHTALLGAIAVICALVFIAAVIIYFPLVTGH